MKNKNLLLPILLSTISLVIVACGGSSSQAGTPTDTSGLDSSQGSTALSQVNMLLVGTLKLEDTDQAVGVDQAAKLLPLWQAYRSLSSSQTTAEAEVDALLNQIQAAMTTEQTKAIQEMDLTSTEMMTLMQSMGAGMGPQGTPNPQRTPGSDFPSGGFQGGDPPDFSAGGPPSGSDNGTTRNFPSGGPPSGGGVMVGPGGDAGSAAGLGDGQMVQGTQDPSMQATAQARFSTQASRVNTILLDVLINKLEAKK